VSTPTSGTSGFKKSVESTKWMPSSSRTFATAPINASVFFRGRANSSLASFQSGRIELKILLCFTCPAITACATPSRCSNSIVLESSPKLTQCTRFVWRASSGSASSLIAITAMSMPWLRAPSSTRKGNLPFPAISPQPFALGLLAFIRGPGRLLHNAALRGFHKLHQLSHVFGVAELRAHLRQRLRSIHLRTRQQAEGPLQRFDSFRRKALAF